MAPLSARRGKHRWAALCALLLGAALGVSPALARGETLPEYRLKAVFLYNFTQFVEWPAAAFANADAPLCIGVLGDDPFGSALDDAVRGEKIQGHPLVVRRARTLEQLGACHLVFISRSEQPRVQEILSALEHSPTLTVSELDGFVRSGGVIGFYLEANRLRFEIAPRAAQRRELKLSSQLLSLGKIVEAEPRQS